MTEEEWLACAKPRPMLEILRSKGSARKHRLFSLDCVNRFSPQFDHPLLPHTKRAMAMLDAAIDDPSLAPAAAPFAEEAAAELRSNGCPNRNDLLMVLALLGKEPYRAALHHALLTIDIFTAEFEPPWSSLDDEAYDQASRPAAVHLCQRLREIFGNPFRLVPIDHAWRTRAVTDLAAAVYNGREAPSGLFDNALLVVLADALEDAGCDSADLLSHLRGGGDHVRGCWAVDLILGHE